MKRKKRGAGLLHRALAYACLTALLLMVGVQTSEAQGKPIVQRPVARAPQPQARAPQTQQDSDDFHVGVIFDAGWRWVALGMDSIPRDREEFPMAYHAGIRFDLGGTDGGLYLAGRFDGYAPTGFGTFPWQAQGRIGFSWNEEYFDVGGPRSSTSRSYQGTTCGYVNCVDTYRVTTHNWWEPAGWVSGLRYVYAAGHFYDGTQVLQGQRPTQQAGAVGVGIGIIETKFTTWFAETELLYFPFEQWRDPNRSDWGWWLRAGTLLGPVFIDISVLLDPAIGGELSLGGGIWLGG